MGSSAEPRRQSRCAQYARFSAISGTRSSRLWRRARARNRARDEMGDCRTFPHFEKDSVHKAARVSIRPTAIRARIRLALISTPIFELNAARTFRWHGTGLFAMPTPAHKRAFDKGASVARTNQRLRADVDRWVTPSSNAMRPRIHPTVRPHRILSDFRPSAAGESTDLPLTMNEPRRLRSLSD